MKNPLELILWALAIGMAWVMLTSITGLDDFLKKLVGRKEKSAALEARIEKLEKRIDQLEQKSSQVQSAK